MGALTDYLAHGLTCQGIRRLLASPDLLASPAWLERGREGAKSETPTRDAARHMCRKVSGRCWNVSEIAILGQMSHMAWMETGCVCISLSLSIENL